MKVKSESEVAQPCLTLSDPMDCSPPGSAVPGILQARVLEWGAIAFSLKRPLGCFINDRFQVSFFSPVLLSSFSYGCSHKFWETNSLRRTMQKWSAADYTGGPKAESPLSQRL